MLGLFNLFGRSDDLKALDQALREAGVHPRTVPEAVKLTTVRLLKEAPGAGARIPDAAYAEAAQLLGYCMLGPEQFVASNSMREAEGVERRLEAAIAVGTGLDARLILLALHSGLIVAEVADRFDVETR
jgi:hypothetical protein